MDFSTEDEDTPPPFLKRRSTWLFAAAGLVALVLAGRWLKVASVEKEISALTSQRQYDAAWSKLRSSRSWLGDCSRIGLEADLVRQDDRADTLVLRAADSLKGCRVPADSILELVSLGNLRIAEHSSGLDSSALWGLHTTAFTAASKCVEADSSNMACRALGFRALVGMKDSYAQISWIKGALARWPKDSQFLAMDQEATRANEAARSGIEKAPAAVAPEPAAKKSTKAKKKDK